ncbi:MAG: YhjD/YihY/BrkB family envelope integrity protein [Acidimicrobiales bacterium]
MTGDTATEASGLISVARSLKDRIKRHQAPIFAAAVAFFAFLALIPTLTGLIGIYGLVANADDVTEQLTDALSGAPESTRTFLVEQMRTIADGSSGALGVSVVVSILIALFSASGAMANLIKALNVAYELEETRKPWTLRGLAMGLMFGGVIVLCMVLFLMTALPSLLAEIGLGRVARLILNIARYPVLALFMAGALSLLYRLGPDHRGNDRPLSPRLLTVGGLVATILFVVLSALFSFYTANLGSYGETYGPLATIIVLLVWFQLSALSIIVGAELDAELADRAWRERTGLEDPTARVGDGESAGQRLLAATAAQDVPAMMASWHRSGIERNPLFGDLAVPEQLEAELYAFHAAFPHMELEPLECVGNQSTATVRYRLEGDFTGDPWHGVTANGRHLELEIAAFLTVEEGYIVRNDVLFDTASVVDQLGFRPGATSTTHRLRAGLGNLRTRLRNRGDRADDDNNRPVEVA